MGRPRHASEGDEARTSETPYRPRHGARGFPKHAARVSDFLVDAESEDDDGPAKGDVPSDEDDAGAAPDDRVDESEGASVRADEATGPVVEDGGDAADDATSVDEADDGTDANEGDALDERAASGDVTDDANAPGSNDDGAKEDEVAGDGAEAIDAAESNEPGEDATSGKGADDDVGQSPSSKGESAIVGAHGLWPRRVAVMVVVLATVMIVVRLLAPDPTRPASSASPARHTFGALAFEVPPGWEVEPVDGSVTIRQRGEGDATVTFVRDDAPAGQDVVETLASAVGLSLAELAAREDMSDLTYESGPSETRLADGTVAVAATASVVDDAGVAYQIDARGICADGGVYRVVATYVAGSDASAANALLDGIVTVGV